MCHRIVFHYLLIDFFTMDHMYLLHVYESSIVLTFCLTFTTDVKKVRSYLKLNFIYYIVISTCEALQPYCNLLCNNVMVRLQLKSSQHDQEVNSDSRNFNENSSGCLPPSIAAVFSLKLQTRPVKYLHKNSRKRARLKRRFWLKSTLGFSKKKKKLISLKSSAMPNTYEIVTYSICSVCFKKNSGPPIV